MPPLSRLVHWLAGCLLAALACLQLAVSAGATAPPTSPPALRGRLIQPAPGERLTAPDSSSRPEDIARRFLEDQIAPAGEIALLAEVEGGGGMRFLSFEQSFDGLPVHLGRITIAVDAEGSVLAARVGPLAPTGPQPLGSAILLPDAASARAEALARDGYTSDALAPLLRDQSPAVATLVATVSGAQRAWSVRLAPPSDPHAVEEILLAMEDGRELSRFAAHFNGVESARVWPSDPALPDAWVLFPDPLGNPSAHSPLGWTDALETSGNNVLAFLDRDGRGDPALGQTTQAINDPPVFDFPFTGDPVVDTDSAVTNVFWALNFAHDRFRLVGFNEASGAMQVDNYGRGGVEGDRVLAGVQDRSIDGTVATNQVTLSRTRDGGATTLRVGLFTDRDSGVTKDAAFETDLLLHEYAHGVTVRMIEDNPACLNGQQPAALAEGWSDFLAASFTNDPVIGGWLADNRLSGLRAFALDANPLSYLNFCAGARGCNAIGDGEIWGGTLWDIRELFVNEAGADGVEQAERLIVEALRYTTCQPTFLDARDGLLLADEALFGGEHFCALWQIFAGRGMGVNATTTGPTDTLPFPGFSTAPPCVGAPSIAFDQTEYGLAEEALIEVGDPAPLPGASVRIEASSGDVETLLLSELPGGPRLRARVTLEPGTASAGDGVLQVADGDMLTASYEVAGLSTNASVTSAFPVRYLIHLVLASNCQAEPDDDHADAPGYFVTGFLDAGETADIIFAFESSAPAPLFDAEVSVESLNPNVSILPTVPLPLGTIPGAMPGSNPLVLFTVRATASAAVVSGEEAELRFQFRSQGRSSERSVRLVLNMDYVRVQGVSPFLRGVETFDLDSPTRDLWTHQANAPGPDGWRLEDCAGVGGTPGYGNTSASCAGYPDNQGAPVLLSPPLLAGLPSDAAGWRYEGLSWKNDVDLWVDPRAIDRFCDLDFVAAFLTDDPASLPYADPLLVLLAARGNPLTGWVYLGNTDGFETTTIALSTAAQAVDPAVDYSQRRLAFIFWSDIVNETNEPRCMETANQGNFFLDDISFTFEYLRVVPEATPCTDGCGVLLSVVTDPPGPKCAGEAFTLDASSTEMAGCPGELLFSFSGPGVPPEYALTTMNVAPAVGADSADYTIAAGCDLLPSCADSVTLSNGAPQLPGLGGPFDGTLRVRREGDDAVLSWVGAAGPPAYGAWQAGTRGELLAGVATWPLVGTTEEEGPSGEASLSLTGAALEPGLAHYQVLARDLCSDAPILP